MKARHLAVALALFACVAPNAEAQAPSSARALSLGEKFPFEPTTSVRVLVIGEKNAIALKRYEGKSPLLLDVEFDAGSEGTGIKLTPGTTPARMAFVLSIGEQHFPVDYIAFHRLDRDTVPPQVISVTDDLYYFVIFEGKARLGLLFNLPPEASASAKKILKIRLSKEGEPVLVSIAK